MRVAKASRSFCPSRRQIVAKTAAFAPPQFMWAIRLLGGARIEGQEGPIAGRVAQRARLALLSLVAVSRTRSASRERLMAVLWPDSDSERARHLLRDSIYRLREGLGETVLVGSGEELRLDPSQVSCDVWDFERAAEAGDFETADRVYAGPFLDGFFLVDSEPFERWVDGERLRLAAIHTRALDSLASARAEQGDWAAVLALRHRVAAADPHNGRVASRYMEALEAAGDRAGALKYAAWHSALLRTELDAAPDPEVEALAERLRRSPLRPAQPSHRGTSGVPSETGTVHAAVADGRQVGAAWRGRGSRWRSGAALLAGAALMAIAARGALVPRDASDIRVGSFTIVTAEPGLEIHPAISPDGKMVAYTAGVPGRTSIFVRPIAGGRAIPLGTDSTMPVNMFPRWSPDGAHILYSTPGRGAFVVPAPSGVPRQVLPNDDGIPWAIWSPDGSEIAFIRRDSLYALSMNSGKTRFISARGRFLHGCDWSPRAPVIACVIGNWEYATPTALFGNIGPSTIVLIPAAGGLATPITDSLELNTSPAWDPAGRRLFFVSDRDGTRDIYALAVSERGEPQGQPDRLTSGLNAQSVAVARDGTRLIYSAYTATANVYSAAVPNSVPATVGDVVAHTMGSQVVERMNVSSDGEWLYYDSNLRGNSDLYRVRVSGGDPQRLTNDPADEYAPIPSPNGQHVAYFSLRSGNRDIYVMPLDGGPVQQVTRTPDHERYPQWSPDGRALAYTAGTRDHSVYTVRRRADGEWEQPVLRARNMGFPNWSPDGRQLAVQWQGRPGIFAIAADSGPPITLFDDTLPGGEKPAGARWSRDGRYLYTKTYHGQQRILFWAIPAAGGMPRQLLVVENSNLRFSRRPSWSTDETRFFFLVDDHRSDLWVAEVTKAR